MSEVMTEAAGTDEELSRLARLGWMVAGILAVLTIIEYVIAVNIDSPLIWLLPFVLAKGWLILDYFMHFRAFLRGEGH